MSVFVDKYRRLNLNKIKELLYSGQASIKDLAEAVNSGREMASSDLLVVCECDYCGTPFLSHPQDAKRASKTLSRRCCWDKTCRISMKKDQIGDRKRR